MKYLCPALLVLLMACNDGKEKPDVSHIKVDLTTERFEPQFFGIDTSNLAAGLAGLRNAFPSFYLTFMQDILQLAPADTASFGIVRQIVGNYKSLYDTVAPKYRSFDAVSDEIEEGFRFVKYYYPDYKVPQLITFIGTLDAPGVVLTDDYLAIGLHQFAGKTFGGYQLPEIQQLYPAYISRRFDKEYIPAAALRAVAEDVYPGRSTGRPLIEQMIELGKQWYLLDLFLPDAPDSLKTGFTGKQLDWLREAEGDAWGYVLKNENLYSVEPVVVQTYIGEAPFTQGMPESSPGNIGPWFGWRIIQKYIAENKDLTPQQVLQTAPRAIFEGAKYKPK